MAALINNGVFVDRTFEVRSRAIKRLARDAILCQDASNLSGLSRDFADVVGELRPLICGGSVDLPNHHIIKLWVSKLHDLSRMGLSDPDRFHQAYEECRRLAEYAD